MAKLVGQITYKRAFPSEDMPPMSVGRCEPDRLLVPDGAFKDTLGDVIRQPDDQSGWLRISSRLDRCEA